MNKTRQVYLITGPTLSGKTKLALKFTSEIDGVLLPMDQLHRYRYINKGTGLDLSAIGSVRNYGYSILNPKTISGPSKYIEWLIHFLKNEQLESPIILEGGCTSYLKAILKEAETNIWLNQLQVFCVEIESSKKKRLVETIRRLCSEKLVVDIIEELSELLRLRYLSRDCYQLFERCEKIFTHPEGNDEGLSWAIRISAKVYFPVFLNILGKIDVSEARERIIKNAIEIQEYQNRRMHQFLDSECFYCYSDLETILKTINQRGHQDGTANHIWLHSIG